MFNRDRLGGVIGGGGEGGDRLFSSVQPELQLSLDVCGGEGRGVGDCDGGGGGEGRGDSVFEKGGVLASPADMSGGPSGVVFAGCLRVARRSCQCPVSMAWNPQLDNAPPLSTSGTMSRRFLTRDILCVRRGWPRFLGWSHQVVSNRVGR